jgi:hypothetical protein
VVVAPTCASVQGLPEKLPAPLLANVTDPSGAEPAFESETVTVQVVDWLIATVAGAQPVTVVVVAFTATADPASGPQPTATDTASAAAASHPARARIPQHATARGTQCLILCSVHPRVESVAGLFTSLPAMLYREIIARRWSIRAGCAERIISDSAFHQERRACVEGRFGNRSPAGW